MRRTQREPKAIHDSWSQISPAELLLIEKAVQKAFRRWLSSGRRMPPATSEQELIQDTVGRLVERYWPEHRHALVDMAPRLAWSVLRTVADLKRRPALQQAKLLTLQHTERSISREESFVPDRQAAVLQALFAQLKKLSPEDARVAHAFLYRGSEPITNVAKELGMSRTRLHRRWAHILTQILDSLGAERRRNRDLDLALDQLGL